MLKITNLTLVIVKQTSRKIHSEHIFSLEKPLGNIAYGN